MNMRLFFLVVCLSALFIIIRADQDLAADLGTPLLAPKFTDAEKKEIMHALTRAESTEDPDAASALYNQALRIDPGNPYALSGMAYLSSQRNEHLTALEYLRQALKRQHNEVEQTVFNLGFTAQSLNRFDEALSYYLLAIKLNPKSSEAYLKAAFIFRSKGDTYKTMDLLQKAISADPKRPHSYQYLGDMLNNIKQFAKAIDLYKKAIEVGGPHPDVIIAIADAYSNMSKYVEALQYYRQAWRLSKSAEGLVGMFHIQRDMSQWDKWAVLVKKTEEAVTSLLAQHKPSPLPPYSTLFTDTEPRLARAVSESWAQETIKVQRRAVGYTRPTYKHTFKAIDNLNQEARAVTFCRDKVLETTRFSEDKIIVKPAVIIPMPEAFRPFLHRKLRVGFISRRFERYAGAQLVLRTFGLYDRTKFEIYGYGNGNDDNSLERQIIAASVDHWRDTWMMSPMEVAKTIAADGVDVLVDSDGMHNFNNLEVLSLRPAPVQITMLGFASTSGAAGVVDYILVDPIIAPPRQVPYSSYYHNPVVMQDLIMQPNPPHWNKLFKSPTPKPRWGLRSNLLPKIFNLTQKGLLTDEVSDLSSHLSETPIYMPYTYQVRHLFHWMNSIPIVLYSSSFYVYIPPTATRL